MKKKYVLIIAVIGLSFVANSQTASLKYQTQQSQLHTIYPTIDFIPQVKYTSANNTNMVVGDTIFYFNGRYFQGSGISSATTPPFSYANDDVDSLPVATASFYGFSPRSSFIFFSELNAVTGDSSFFIGATSFFTPAAQSDNWFSVGPITIPVTGATLSWQHNVSDPAYRDGYEVLVSTSGISNHVDFTNSPIYVVNDMDSTTVADTAAYPNKVFATRSTSLAAYAGQNIYVGFHHNATDMFILYLKNILIIEDNSLGITQNDFLNGVKIFQNNPNPFKGISEINYELEKSATVSLVVYDITGKEIALQNEGEQIAGRHFVKFNAENLKAGVYYYSLKVGTNSTTSMKMIILK